MLGTSTGSSSGMRRPYRSRVGHALLAALGTAALVFAGAMPATAAPAPADSTQEVLDFLGVAPPAPAFLDDTDMTVTGVPIATEAGAPFTVGFEVQSSVVGIDSPTGEVSLVGTTSGPAGFELLGTEALVEGQAAITVRPMGLGEQTLIAVYLGDNLHWPVVQILDPVTVTPVATVVNIDIDSDSPAYGGGTMGVWTSVLSVCENEATDPDVAALCQSTHGDPDGEVTLLMDGVPVGTQPIQGSNQLGVPTWLDLDTDLSNPEASSIVRFDVDVPDRALGTPEHYSLTAEFTPNNWFAESSDVFMVETKAAATSTEVVVGDLANPTTKVKVGETVQVSAFVAAEPSWSGPIDGVVNLWVNGNLAAEGLQFADDFPAVSEDISFGEAGEYSLVAEFVPRSLNHTGSKSAAYTFTVEAVTPDGGSDSGSNGGADGAANSGSDGGSNGSANSGSNGGSNSGGPDKQQKPAVPKGQLAHTGADGAPALVGLGALLFAGAGIALVAAQRRRASRARV